MTAWASLDEELSRWSDADGTVTMWWRDDDAATVTPALERLLQMRRTYDLGLARAVIAAHVSGALRASLAEEPACVTVLQRGYRHRNHAPAGEKKAELGPHRPAQVVIGELGTGMLAMEQHFGARFLPILVPPWNRI